MRDKIRFVPAHPAAWRIAEYLAASGTLEHSQANAAHESRCTTIGSCFFYGHTLVTKIFRRGSWQNPI